MTGLTQSPHFRDVEAKTQRKGREQPKEGRTTDRLPKPEAITSRPGRATSSALSLPCLPPGGFSWLRWANELLLRKRLISLLQQVSVILLSLANFPDLLYQESWQPGSRKHEEGPLDFWLQPIS